MKKTMLLVALLAANGLVMGCNKKSGDSAASGGGESIGVAECDDYFKKMTDCLAKMPAQAKAATEQAFNASRDAWKNAAATAAGKDALKTTCKAALDALAQNPVCK